MRIFLELIFKQTWIIFIMVTIANALTLKSKSKSYIAANPELEEGYEKLFKGIIFYGNIPWVIIGIGNLSGLTKSVFDFFAPRQMNPIVLIFHFSIVLLWTLSIKWIYFQNGAEFLERHPGLLKFQTAKQIKLFFPLMLLGGIIAMIVMWVMNPSIPNFQ
ncbi:hypothetical protein [Ferruginibacter albus]|uniref:hypothetical protein n=1 Tax=Ferruginibacter albus TaxID=2875540 RepID=UPI001CC6D863|nr:hypothetical protein [Ferruginibacter albus]UAY50940.1 hypothetical protein K9M53_10100 [Ferruginibacter albus]